MSQATSNENPASKGFIAAVTAAGLLVFAFALFRVGTSPVNPEWLLMSLLTLLVISRIHLQIPKISTTATLSDTFVYVSMFLYGVYPSVLLAGADALMCSVFSPNHTNKRKVVPFNVGVMSLSIWVSGSAVELIFGRLSEISDWGRLSLVAGSLSLVHYLLNAGMVSIVSALRNRRNLIATWRESFLWTSITYFAGAGAACLVTKLITVVSFYALVITLPMLLITYLTYKNYIDRIQVSLNHVAEMADLHLRTIEALAIAIDAKDEVTHDHVHRVQAYATGLAKRFGLSDGEVEALKAGALLHDIGKLAVPDYILNKPGKLTIAEYDKMKTHTIVGAEILERVRFPYPVVPIVRHHHERWDGRGYPDGLRGEQIPMTARILSVVDCFDAVREDRQYRKAMAREQAIELLKLNSGTMYDPNVVKVFLEHLPEFEEELRQRKIVDCPVEAKALPAPSGTEAETDIGALEQIRSAHREVTTLYEIAQTMATSLDLHDTFAIFSSKLSEIVSYTTCLLCLQSPDSTDIEVAQVVGANPERFRGRRISAGSGITGWVVANHKPIHNSDPRLDFDALKTDVDVNYRTSAIVPLLKDGLSYGAIALYSMDTPAYDPEQIRLIEAVTGLASDAIANALHHQSTEAEALTDCLTRLPNARALRNRLEQELGTARRTDEPFVVLMMDLDNLKTINDTLGHGVGDEVLKIVSRIMSTQLRSTDFLCRYAGDEFIAVLRVDRDGLPDLIGRIQTAVEEFPFQFGGTQISVGVSAGWACFGEEGFTMDELLLKADRAMYIDKFRRKSSGSQSATPAKGQKADYHVM
jgi:diguanylate cyclase (GGDEF)-like protein/putative nucleotidyltransferase with HDIG domain